MANLINNNSSIVYSLLLKTDFYKDFTSKKISQVIIGPAYTGVEVDSTLGVSYTYFSRAQEHQAVHLLSTKKLLTEQSISKILSFLNSKYGLLRSIAVATLNSLSQIEIKEKELLNENEDIIKWISSNKEVDENQTVGLVGDIIPIRNSLIRAGYKIKIVDEFYTNKHSNKSIIHCKDLSELKSVDHLLISGSSLVYPDFNILAQIIKNIPGERILVGPSAQLFPSLAKKMHLTGLASSFITDPSKVLTIIGQGAGYHSFKRYCAKYTIKLD